MLSRDKIDSMRQDAQLALTNAYGYPVARVHCAHHVIALLGEIDRLEASLCASSGDFAPLRKLAGIED